jgi:hypothetical protein
MSTCLACYKSFQAAYPKNWKAILRKHDDMLLTSEGSMTIATRCQTFNKSFKSMHNLVSSRKSLPEISHNLILRDHRRKPTLSNSASRRRLSWPAMPSIKTMLLLRYT